MRSVRQLIKLRLLWMILVAFLLLSGCVRDDVGITFKDANHGVFTQRIRFSSQLSGISQATAELWLDQLIAQTEQMSGKTQHPTEREWVLSVPFANVKDLVQKFEQLQHLADRSDAAPISKLSIQTNNWIIWQRQHLSYDLDLRSLGIVPNVKSQASVLIDPKELLVIEFSLNTPWGARPSQVPPAAIYRKGRELKWLLNPGAENHLEAVFWLPSSVGIGAVMITGLVIIGMFLKAWLKVSDLSAPDLSNSSASEL